MPETRVLQSAEAFDEACFDSTFFMMHRWCAECQETGAKGLMQAAAAGQCCIIQCSEANALLNYSASCRRSMQKQDSQCWSEPRLGDNVNQLRCRCTICKSVCLSWMVPGGPIRLWRYISTQTMKGSYCAARRLARMNITPSERSCAPWDPFPRRVAGTHGRLKSVRNERQFRSLFDQPGHLPASVLAKWPLLYACSSGVWGLVIDFNGCTFPRCFPQAFGCKALEKYLSLFGTVACMSKMTHNQLQVTLTKSDCVALTLAWDCLLESTGLI